MLARIWNERSAPRAWMFVALALAFAFRIPLAVLPVGADSDIVRYVWDGRVQHLGLNPYLVVPANPALTYTHTAETWQMPSRRWRTSYPPGSQLFFRAVTAVHDSAIAMKLALVLCDLITIFVVRRWLRMTGRSEWLTLAYAWSPLVVLEVAHSGHIDALGAMWIALAALAFTARWTMIASVLAVVAIASCCRWCLCRCSGGACGGGATVATLAGLLMAGPSAWPKVMLEHDGVVHGVRFNGPQRLVADPRGRRWCSRSPSFAAPPSR
jgi:hypothetical protein